MDVCLCVCGNVRESLRYPFLVGLLEKVRVVVSLGNFYFVRIDLYFIQLNIILSTVDLFIKP